MAFNYSQCSPEDFFIPVDQAAENGMPFDAMGCLLKRLSASLHLLEIDAYENHETGFTLNHSIICDMLWALRGQVDQAIYLEKVMSKAHNLENEKLRPPTEIN